MNIDWKSEWKLNFYSFKALNDGLIYSIFVYSINNWRAESKKSSVRKGYKMCVVQIRILCPTRTIDFYSQLFYLYTNIIYIQHKKWT